MMLRLNSWCLAWALGLSLVQKATSKKNIFRASLAEAQTCTDNETFVCGYVVDAKGDVVNGKYSMCFEKKGVYMSKCVDKALAEVLVPGDKLGKKTLISCGCCGTEEADPPNYCDYKPLPCDKDIFSEICTTEGTDAVKVAVCFANADGKDTKKCFDPFKNLGEEQTFIGCGSECTPPEAPSQSPSQEPSTMPSQYTSFLAVGDLREMVADYYSNGTDDSELRRGVTAKYGTIEEWLVGEVKDFSTVFDSASYSGLVKTFLQYSFNPDLSNWNTAKATNMERMFYKATAFVGDGLSDWDVGKVTNMRSTFRRAGAFSGDLSSWDVSKVTTMENTFSEASSFNADISSWNVGNVTSLSSTFYYAEIFKGDLSSWDVSKVTNMANTFNGQSQYAGSIFNADISSWNVGKVTTMFKMFYNTRLFNGNISSWDVSQVTSMRFMFDGAQNFNSDLSSWNVSQVEDFEQMFYHTNAFVGDGLSGWNLNKAKNMKSMFKDADAFDQDLCAWGPKMVNVPNATMVENMFSDGVCPNQTSPVQTAGDWVGPFCKICNT